MALLGLNNQFSGALDAGFAEGRARGMLDARKDNREERALEMDEETQSWKRDAIEKEKLLQAGMAAAAKDGGYEAVITYLQKTDPERAINFTSAKEKLDAQIMDNQVMKNIKIPSMQQDALLESYGKLGKMGAAILQLPEDQREGAYKQMLPIAKVINPNMPDTLAEGAPTLLLAAAQATPANQLFKYGKSQYEAQSNVGKIGQDIEAYRKAGVTPGDGTPQGETLLSLLAEKDRWRSQSIQSTIGINKTQMQMQQNQSAATQQVSKNLAQQSVFTPTYMQAYSSMEAAFNVLGKDPTNSQAMEQLARAFVKANVGGQASDFDSRIAYGASGYESLTLKVKSLLSGKATPLNANDIANLHTVVTDVNSQLITMQKGIESQFEQSVQPFGDLVDWKNVVKPSEYFNNQQQNAASNNMAASGSIPPDIQQQAKDAIAKGADPKKVQARIQQLMQDKAQAAQQTDNPTMTPQDYSEMGDGSSE